MAITVITSGGGSGGGNFLPLTGGTLTDGLTIKNGYLDMINKETINSIYLADQLTDGSDEASLYAEANVKANTFILNMYNIGNLSTTTWTHNQSYNTLQMRGATSRIILQSNRQSGNLSIVNQGTKKYISGLTPPTTLNQAANKQYVDDFTTYCYYSSSLDNPIYNADIQLSDKTNTTWTFTAPANINLFEVTVGVTTQKTGATTVNLTYGNQAIGTLYCYNSSGNGANTLSRTWLFYGNYSNSTITANISQFNNDILDWWVYIKTIDARV